MISRMQLIAIIISLQVLSIMIVLVEATEYFVSFDGDDSNPGTLQKPWRHVQKAVTVLNPGDTCMIREGHYSEEVSISGLKGTMDKPIVFRSYPGETVIFDGTAPIQSEWEIYKDDIFVTTVNKDVWQLFVDGEMQINARWPNAFWYDFSVFDYKKWGFANDKSTFDPASGTGVIVDNGTRGLARSGVNATGAIAILNIGSWMTWAGLVRNTPLERMPLALICSKVLEDTLPFTGKTHDTFKLEFLDAPSEWFYDSSTKKLYLWLHESDHPRGHDIHTKISTYAFTVTSGSTWIVFSNLKFFATTVYISGKDDTDDIGNIRLESLHFSYPSYSKRMLGSLAIPNMTTVYYNGLLTKNAGNFSIFNCTWEYADEQTMQYRGADGVFENNLWHHNDFTCVGIGQLLRSYGVRDTFLRNTVHSNGPSIGFYPGSGFENDRKLGLSVAAKVSLNLFYDLKYLQNDGSHVQTAISSQNGTVIDYNWSYEDWSQI